MISYSTFINTPLPVSIAQLLDQHALLSRTILLAIYPLGCRLNVLFVDIGKKVSFQIPDTFDQRFPRQHPE
jgi:hypothetical protein